jgi:hypothetical protein
MSVLYIRDGSSVSTWLVYGPAVISVTSHISTSSCMLCCSRCKVTAMSTKSSFILQHTSAYRNTFKLFLPYLERPWACDLFVGQPWSLWCHLFLFRPPCCAAGNIRLLLHQQRVHSICKPNHKQIIRSWYTTYVHSSIRNICCLQIFSSLLGSWR